jgi:hypothetical protein
MLAHEQALYIINGLLMSTHYPSPVDIQLGLIYLHLVC